MYKMWSMLMVVVSVLVGGCSSTDVAADEQVGRVSSATNWLDWETIPPATSRVTEGLLAVRVWQPVPLSNRLLMLDNSWDGDKYTMVYKVLNLNSNTAADWADVPGQSAGTSFGRGGSPSIVEWNGHWYVFAVDYDTYLVNYTWATPQANGTVVWRGAWTPLPVLGQVYKLGVTTSPAQPPSGVPLHRMLLVFEPKHLFNPATYKYAKSSSTAEPLIMQGPFTMSALPNGNSAVYKPNLYTYTQTDVFFQNQGSYYASRFIDTANCTGFNLGGPQCWEAWEQLPKPTLLGNGSTEINVSQMWVLNGAMTECQYINWLPTNVFGNPIGPRENWERCSTYPDVYPGWVNVGTAGGTIAGNSVGAYIDSGVATRWYLETTSLVSPAGTKQSHIKRGLMW